MESQTVTKPGRAIRVACVAYVVLVAAAILLLSHWPVASAVVATVLIVVASYFVVLACVASFRAARALALRARR